MFEQIIIGFWIGLGFGVGVTVLVAILIFLDYLTHKMRIAGVGDREFVVFHPCPHGVHPADCTACSIINLRR